MKHVMRYKSKRLRSIRQRGLTLVELMLALLLTAFVAGAIAGMLAAVSAGVGTRRDVRSTMVRASALQSRLSSYIIPAHAILDCTGDQTVIWFSDSNSNGGVNGSELRWITYDPNAGSLFVEFVDFPPSWTQTQIDEADKFHESNSNWTNVYKSYNSQGLIQSIELADSLVDALMTIDGVTPLDSTMISFNLTFGAGDFDVATRLSPSIRVPVQPTP